MSYSKFTKFNYCKKAINEKFEIESNGIIEDLSYSEFISQKKIVTKK